MTDGEKIDIERMGHLSHADIPNGTPGQVVLNGEDRGRGTRDIPQGRIGTVLYARHNKISNFQIFSLAPQGRLRNPFPYHE